MEKLGMPSFSILPNSYAYYLVPKWEQEGEWSLTIRSKGIGAREDWAFQRRENTFPWSLVWIERSHSAPASLVQHLAH